MNEQTYDAPELTVLGEVAELTAGKGGNETDFTDGPSSLDPDPQK